MRRTITLIFTILTSIALTIAILRLLVFHVFHRDTYVTMSVIWQDTRALIDETGLPNVNASTGMEGSYAATVLATKTGGVYAGPEPQRSATDSVDHRVEEFLASLHSLC